MHPPRPIRALSIPTSVCILHLQPRCRAPGFAVDPAAPHFSASVSQGDGSTSQQGFQEGSAPPDHSHHPSTPHLQIYLPQVQAAITKLRLLEPSLQPLLNYPRGSELWGRGKENLWSSGDPPTNSENLRAQRSGPKQQALPIRIRGRRIKIRSSSEQSHFPLMYIHGGKKPF